jgi:hypothetical protein
VTIATAAAASGYPVTFDVEYPGELSRWMIFVKWLLAIPHIVVLYLLILVAAVVQFIVFFAILFTKKYPPGLFNFVVGVNRWAANVSAYIFLRRDEYPPFSMDAGKYPVTFDVEYPGELSRWLIFVKWLLVLPNAIVVVLLLFAAEIVTCIAWFAILFTKKYPESLFQFVVGALRWQHRANAYSNLMTDKYPPFSMQP